MTSTIATTDTNFAAALMTRGGKLYTWRKTDDDKVEWTITEADTEWVEDFKQGRDLFLQLFANKKMLVGIAKTLQK